MLLTVHADIVQQVATTCKFNERFWLKIIKCSIPSYISVHFLFSISLKSSTCIPQKATGVCTHTFTFPHIIRIWIKKHNSSLFMYLVLFDNPLKIIVIFYS